MGFSLSGQYDFEKPFKDPHSSKYIWARIPIHQKRINGGLITFYAKRWPFVLIEIIEETIQN